MARAFRAMEISIRYMNVHEIIYKTKAASEADIFVHLKECSALFVPDLSAAVDIREYAGKIFHKSVTFEAWVKQRLAGLVAVYCNDVETKSAYITSVSVVRECSGLGIASRLLEMCISYVELNFFTKIVLEVNASNAPAVNLYKKYGFAIFESKESSFLMKLELPAFSELPH